MEGRMGMTTTNGGKGWDEMGEDGEDISSEMLRKGHCPRP